MFIIGVVATLVITNIYNKLFPDTTTIVRFQQDTVITLISNWPKDSTSQLIVEKLENMERELAMTRQQITQGGRGTITKPSKVPSTSNVDLIEKPVASENRTPIVEQPKTSIFSQNDMSLTPGQQVLDFKKPYPNFGGYTQAAAGNLFDVDCPSISKEKVFYEIKMTITDPEVLKQIGVIFIDLALKE